MSQSIIIYLSPTVQERYIYHALSSDLLSSHSREGSKFIFGGLNRLTRQSSKWNRKQVPVIWPHLRPPRRQAQVTEKLQNKRWGGGLPFPHPAEIHGNSPRGGILTADVRELQDNLILIRVTKTQACGRFAFFTLPSIKGYLCNNHNSPSSSQGD